MHPSMFIVAKLARSFALSSDIISCDFAFAINYSAFAGKTVRLTLYKVLNNPITCINIGTEVEGALPFAFLSALLLLPLMVLYYVLHFAWTL